MPVHAPRSRPPQRPEANPPDPNLEVPVEILDAQGLPLAVMPMAQAVGQGLCFRKALTAMFAGNRLFLRQTASPPVKRETRRGVFELFTAPVPMNLAPEDVAGLGPAALLGYEPSVRFLAELPPEAGFPARLSLFGVYLSAGAAALPAGKGLPSFDADELYGLTAQSPELFSADLLRVLKTGALFPRP